MSSRSDGGWPPLPLPQAKPMTVREAIGHLPVGKAEAHAPNVIAQWQQKARYVGSFYAERLDPDKPSPTQVKAQLKWHWAVPRQLTITEAALLASFPEDFIWPGTKSETKERIGNSVPPRFAQAIAEVLRDEVLGAERFTYISTFAGCGGSSLGYKWAGGRGLAAVEFDANAVATYRVNFPDTPVIAKDICLVTAEELMEVAGIKVGELDILDGSPPCQGFSTAGKRVITDPRNSLFREYVRLIEGLQPRIFVMENVSGMVKGKMKLVFREVMLALKATGYDVRCKLLNAMYFNVPQSRERLIWIGVRPDVERPPTFPNAQGKPVTVREALDGCSDPAGPVLKSKAAAIGKLIPPGDSNGGGKYSTRIGLGTWGFQMCRLAWDKPAPTVCKSMGDRMIHPEAQCGLSAQQVARLGSFPDDFRWVGTGTAAIERIGNSVPPRFAQAIAEHIRDEILEV